MVVVTGMSVKTSLAEFVLVCHIGSCDCYCVDVCELVFFECGFDCVDVDGGYCVFVVYADSLCIWDCGFVDCCCEWGCVFPADCWCIFFG